MKIRQVLDDIAHLPYLLLLAELSLEQAAENISQMKQVRGIYVVDRDGRLRGTLSLGALIRNVMAARRKNPSYVRSLLVRITSETVGDIMDRHVIYASMDDDVDSVLERMVDHNIKEVPVVDDEKRIIANAGILDLWRMAEN